MASAATSVSSVRAKSACQSSRCGGRVSHCRVGATTWAKVMVPKRSSRVRQASSSGGDGRGLDPLQGNPAASDEILPRRQPRRGALAGDDRDSLGLRVIDHDRDLAAEAEQARVGHAQCQDRRRGTVRGIPAGLRMSMPASTASRPPADTAPFIPVAFQSEYFGAVTADRRAPAADTLLGTRGKHAERQSTIPG